MLATKNVVSKLFGQTENCLAAYNKALRSSFATEPQKLKGLEGLRFAPGIKTDVVQINANSKVISASAPASRVIASSSLDADKILDLKIPNMRFLGSNSISGATFEIRPDADLLTLKEAGINQIIDFRSEASSGFAKKCKEFGFDYFNLPLEQSYNLFSRGNKGNKPLKVSETFIKQLKQYFELSDKGNAFVGCRFGIDRTNIGLTYNYLMNVNAKKPPVLFSWGDFKHTTVINRTVKAVKKTIKNLTPEQRKTLNLPDNYDEILKNRIYNLRLKNGVLSGPRSGS